MIMATVVIQQLLTLFNQLYKIHIMPLVIKSLGRGHKHTRTHAHTSTHEHTCTHEDTHTHTHMHARTHTRTHAHTHTDDPHKTNFKKPGMLAAAGACLV